MECVESMLKSRRLHETRAVVERASAVRAMFGGQPSRTCAVMQTTNAGHKTSRIQQGIVVVTDYRQSVVRSVQHLSVTSFSLQCSVRRGGWPRDKKIKSLADKESGLDNANVRLSLSGLSASRVVESAVSFCDWSTRQSYVDSNAVGPH